MAANKACVKQSAYLRDKILNNKPPTCLLMQHIGEVQTEINKLKLAINDLPKGHHSGGFFNVKNQITNIERGVASIWQLLK